MAAGTAMVSVEVDISGPLATGAVRHAVDAALAEAVDAVGTQAIADVHWVLDRRIKHPTPYYETQIAMDRAVNSIVIHDRGVIYGPWLEGVSHRNQTTRFKGYHAFRMATQEAQEYAPIMANQIVARRLAMVR